MFISGGSGRHELNRLTTSYSGNTIFFLSPEDSHYFEIKDETCFSVIKFLPTVLKGGINTSATDFWDHLLNSLVRKWNSVNEKNADVQVTNKLFAIVELMIGEWQENNEQVTEIHTNLLRSLLLVMDKHIKGNGDIGITQYGVTQIERIQHYIHSNIFLPDKLTLKHLSDTFGQSVSGLRGVFKNKMGMSVGAYISSLKIEMIKGRIRNSDHSLSDIALEFGFADPSHFNKFFQKHTATTPLRYKKQIATEPAPRLPGTSIKKP